MKLHEFNKQGAARLYREWHIESSKEIGKQYDKEQIDSLRDYLFSELCDFIYSFSLTNKKYYTATIPILFIAGNKIQTFHNDILVINNTIQSTNMPGCMAVGNSIEDTYFNYLNAVIECADARYRNSLGFMNIVHTISNYAIPADNINREDFVAELINYGWAELYNGTYNSVFIKKDNKVTYTIPKGSAILSDMVLWFRQLRYQVSARMFREENLTFSDITNWSCDACDGDYTTGCLLSDPSNCSRG